MQVFPAWPRDWDTEYSLFARGGFAVTSSMRKGEVEFVEIESQLGSRCRVRNPWGESGVALYRNGRQSQELKGALLEFPTAKGELVILVPAGSSPERLKRKL